MFCPHCGHALDDGSKFCVSCGNAVNAAAKRSDDEVIDLTKVTPEAPEKQTKLYKGTVISAIAVIVIQIITAIAGYLICEGIPLKASHGLLAALVSLAFVCVPVGTIGLIVVKLKKKASGELPKLPKGRPFLLHFVTTLGTTLALTLGYIEGIVSDYSVADFAMFILIPLFAFISIFTILTVVLFTKGIGKEGMYKLWSAFFWSYFIAIPLTYLLAKLIEVMFISIVVLFAGTILFFVCGGRVIFYKEV